MKVYPLESVRGMAAIVVVLFHYPTSSWLTSNQLVRNGPLMVDLFFVLSGFVIAMNYLNRLATGREVLKFMRKRFWRLYPLQFVTLLLLVVVEFSKFAVESKTGRISTNPAFSVNNFEAFANHLLLTQAVYLDHLTFNGPSWSISAEFITYMVFALVIFHARGHGIAVAALLLVSAGATLLATCGIGVRHRLGACEMRILILHRRTRIRVVQSHWAEKVSIPFAHSHTTVDRCRRVCRIFPKGIDPLDLRCHDRGACANAHRFGDKQDSRKPPPDLPWYDQLQHIHDPYAGVVVSQSGIAVWFRGDLGDAHPGFGTVVVLAGLAIVLLVSNATYRWVEDPFRKGIPRYRSKLVNHFG